MVKDENMGSEQSDTNEDIETIRQQDESRLPAGHHEGSSDLTTGTTGERVGVKKPTNPEDRFDE